MILIHIMCSEHIQLILPEVRLLQFQIQAFFPNANLIAETTTESEIGLEMNLLGGKLGFDFSYYDKTTEDLLTDLDVSPSTGFSGITTNAGSIKNTGFEALVRINPIETVDLNGM